MRARRATRASDAPAFPPLGDRVPIVGRSRRGYWVGKRTVAVPNTRVSRAALAIVMSISTVPASSSMSVTTPAMVCGVSASTGARKTVSITTISALGAPAVDHRPKKPLAHHSGNEGAGKSFLAGRLVIREPRSAPADMSTEPLDVVDTRVGRECGQFLTELDIVDGGNGFAHEDGSLITVRVSAFATWVPFSSYNSMRRTRNTMRPERPVFSKMSCR